MYVAAPPFQGMARYAYTMVEGVVWYRTEWGRGRMRQKASLINRKTKPFRQVGVERIVKSPM